MDIKSWILALAGGGSAGTEGAAGKDGVSPTVVSTGSTESGASAGTITGADGSVITVYNGKQGPAGSDASVDTSGLVSDVSITNENGVYGISQTKGGVKTDVGSIEVPSIDNVLAEVTDSVVETTSGNYQNDYHTIKETEHNGTQNDVGTFRIARNQITQLNSDGSYHMIDQSGNATDGQISISGGGRWEDVALNSIFDIYDKAILKARIAINSSWEIHLDSTTLSKVIVGPAFTDGVYVESSASLTGNFVISWRSGTIHTDGTYYIIDGYVSNSGHIDRISSGAHIKLKVNSSFDVLGFIIDDPGNNYNAIVVGFFSGGSVKVRNYLTKTTLTETDTIQIYVV